NLFYGRAWVSHQVAEEFFRNRNKVILSSTTAFNETEKNIAEIRKIIEEPLKKIKNSRIISDDIGKTLEKEIEAALKKAESGIRATKEKFPDYIKEDPILDNICKLFESSVGKSFEKDTFFEVLK